MKITNGILMCCLATLLAACGSDTVDTPNNGADHDLGGVDELDMVVADQGADKDQGSVSLDMAMTDVSVGDMGQSDSGAIDMTGEDLGVDMAPTTLYRPSAPMEIATMSISAVQPMKVMWGANGDIVWSSQQAEIVAANGAVKKVIGADPWNVGGGVTLGFDGTYYYTGYVYWDGASSVNRNIYARLGTYDTAGNLHSYEEMTEVKHLLHMEAVWNGSSMGFVGVQIGPIGLFETGATLDANQTITDTSINVNHNHMTSALWDGEAYCMARNGPPIYFACVKGDGTTTRQNLQVGPSLTSHEVDMAKSGDDFHIAYTELSSNPPYTSHVAKVAPDGTVTDTVIDAFFDAETYQSNVAIEHDGQHILLATIEENEGFLTVYDAAFNVVERHALGPAENIDLALSATGKLVVAHANYSANRTYDRVFLRVFER